MNAGGMRSKLCNFRASLDSSDYDVVVISETWLLEDYGDAEICPNGWTPFRRERHLAGATGLGGVVMIIARDDLKPELEMKGGPDFELIWVKLPLPHHNLRVGCCYVPPSSPIEAYKPIIDSCNAVAENGSERDEAILFGDFNLPRLQWVPHDDLENVFLPANVTSEAETIIADELSSQGFFQMYNGTNSRGHVLDLVSALFLTTSKYLNCQ